MKRNYLSTSLTRYPAGSIKFLMPATILWIVLEASIGAGTEQYLSEGTTSRTNLSLEEETAKGSLPASPELRPSGSVQQPADSGKTTIPSAVNLLLRLGGSLVLVVGVFLLLVWLFRQTMPHGFGGLPGEAFEVLGRAPLAYRQQACLVRCGEKVLLLGVSASTVNTLAEINDPAEVERLVQTCRGGRSGVAAAFRRSDRQERGNDV